MYEPGRDLGFYNYDTNGPVTYIGPKIPSDPLIFEDKPQPKGIDYNDYTGDHSQHKPDFKSTSCFGIVAGGRVGAFCKGWDKWKGFHFGTFMTVNGCSIWPGADSTYDGCAEIFCGLLYHGGICTTFSDFSSIMYLKHTPELRRAPRRGALLLVFKWISILQG